MHKGQTIGANYMQIYRAILASACLGVAGTAFAGAPYITKAGDRYVFTLAMASSVDASLVGQKLYWPIAPTRLSGGRIFIGSAAVCSGKFTGNPVAEAVSVEGRAVRMERVTATEFNSNLNVNRRETFNVYVLTGCQFAAPNPDALPTWTPEQASAEHKRDMDEAWKQAEEQLGKERAVCIEKLAARGQATPDNIDAYCD